VALATRFVRSPKAGIARRIRRLNQSINGHQQRVAPGTMTELMMDDSFLAKFFLYFSPSERGVLCQVCRKWRHTLYSPKYWIDAMPVVSYRHLKRPAPPITNTRDRHRSGSNDSYSSTNSCPTTPLRHVYDSIQQRGFDSVCLFGATDEDVNEFVNHLQMFRNHLRCLSVRCSNISDAGLETLFRSLPCIYRLELCGCNDITESGLWACLNAKIVSLTIMDCINVADDTLRAIAQLLPSLYELSLQAYHVTDAALALFSPKQSYTLSVLRLTSCWEVTNNGLVNIVNCLPNLTVLGLSGCSKVTDDGVELLAENLRRLRVLDLSWCPRISDASLEYIACDLAQLEELTLDRLVYSLFHYSQFCLC
jgi:F-box/leucine-rich repeat protein 16